MNKLTELEILLEDGYEDATAKHLSAKTRVHTQEIFLRDLRNKLNQTQDPKRKKSLQDKVREEEGDLQRYKTILRQRELELQAAKQGHSTRTQVYHGGQPQGAEVVPSL